MKTVCTVLVLVALPQLSFAQIFSQISSGSQTGAVAAKNGYYASLSDADTDEPEASIDIETIYDDSDHIALNPARAIDEAMGEITETIPEPILEPFADYGALPMDELEDGIAVYDAGAQGCTACSSGGCDGSGTHCGQRCVKACKMCCGVGRHRSGVYGSYLYLRARNADVAYGVPMNGPVVPPPADQPVQVGGVGIVDPDYQSAYRAGFNLCLDTCSSIDVRYTFFESQTSDEISTSAPRVVRSLVSHPSTGSAASTFLSAHGHLDVDFDTIDVAFRHTLLSRDLWAVNYVLGGRYSRLEQEFQAEFINGGTEQVATDIDFEGAGLRIGLETERYSCHSCLHVYANGSASFLAGRFRGNYFQGQSFDPVVVDTEWEAGRIIPVLDLELGLGWASRCGKYRLRGGYLVSGWYNTVKSQDFITAVQNNDFVNLGDTLTFDGVTARAEIRF